MKGFIRKIYNRRFLPEDKENFLHFLKTVRPALNLIKRHGGSLLYILNILELIHDEEICYPFRQKGRRIPYPWEFKKANPILLSEREISIKKIENGKEVELKNSDPLPVSLIKRLKRIVDSIILLRENNENLEGNINLSFQLDTKLADISYRISIVENMNLQRSIKKRNKKGKRGEPQSDVAMYLLYRYFKLLKIKNIYNLIALLCNNYSIYFYRPPQGAPLSAETVRKRVQWVKKRKRLIEWAERFEIKYLQEVNKV